MSKTGRNDRCYCGSNVKYKRCCLKKEGCELELTKKITSISRKDFISGPFKECPECHKGTFGVYIHTGGNEYGRECINCWHSQSYKFPAIKKRIIYLDQFMISNITKALDSNASSHKKILNDPFWLEVYKKIDTLSKKNLIVCPDSSFHTEESLLCGDPSYNNLKMVYEHLSHGCTFFDHNTITRLQVQQNFKSYMHGDNVRPLLLDAQEVIHGHPHEWTGHIRIDVNMRPYDGQLEAIHKERRANYVSLNSVFMRWQKEKGRNFVDWVKEEAYAFGESTIRAHIAYLKKSNELAQEYAEQYLANQKLNILPEDIFPPPSTEIINNLINELIGHSIYDGAAIKKVTQYLRSDYIINIPTIHISSLLYGALARKAANGQKSNPNIGTVTDVNAISSLLPYSDAIFIDNAMAALLSEQPLKDEVKKYNTKIFSSNTKKQFLDYLDSIETSATQEHVTVVADVYGDTEPYLDLLNAKKLE